MTLVNSAEKIAMQRVNTVNAAGSINGAINNAYAMTGDFHAHRQETWVQLLWDHTRAAWIKFGVENPTEKWEQGSWKPL